MPRVLPPKAETAACPPDASPQERLSLGFNAAYRLAAGRVDAFIANSRVVARRIRKRYRREATIINPPVDTRLYRPLEILGSVPLAPAIPAPDIGVIWDAERVGAPLVPVRRQHDTRKMTT